MKMTAFFQFLVLPGALILSRLAAAQTNTTSAVLPHTTITTFQYEFPANCFNCGPGVKRLDAAIAANAACGYWYKTTMFPNSWNAGGLGFN